MQKEIILVTGNARKAEEVRAIAGVEIVTRDLEIPEIQAVDVEVVAREKALTAFRLTGQPVLVDDTGLNIVALGNLPGALVTWFLQALGPAGIVNLLREEKNRQASVSTCIAYADQKGVHIFTGTIHGQIAESLRGENGFGYDAFFVPEGSAKTYAEMTSAEKNAISMRRIALLKFKDFMEKREK